MLVCTVMRYVSSGALFTGGGGSFSANLFLFPNTKQEIWSGCWRVRICLVPEHFDFPPSGLYVRVIKGLGMSSRACATGHIKDPLIEKSRASCPGGGFPPSFIHQVIIIHQTE